ncbi:MAG: hypothetical protein ACOYYU_13725 [Chloroflexota bacterium]
MNTHPHPIRLVLWFLLGVALALTSLALNRPFPQALGDAAVTPTALTATAQAGSQARADAGSTDGIVLMAVIIVILVILPILLRHKEWGNGRRQK